MKNNWIFYKHIKSISVNENFVALNYIKVKYVSHILIDDKLVLVLAVALHCRDDPEYFHKPFISS